MHRAKEFIEAARRPREDAERFAEEQRVTQEEQARLEAEHRLLNECWKNAGRNRSACQGQSAN